MSYVSVPRGGLGLFDPLPGSDPNSNPAVNNMAAQAKTVGDQSKAQAIAYAQAQLQNYPTAAAVAEQFNTYASYFKGLNADDLKDPKKAAEVMKQALIAYAKANGYPTTTKEAELALADYAASVALGVDVKIPDSFPKNLKDLKTVAVDLAATGVAIATGIDPNMVALTAEDLLSGKLDMNKCESVGTMAGAIAGAAVCSAFGIPAPIGAFIGGKIGGMVGGTVAEIFGLYDPEAAVIAQQAAFDSWEKATLAQAQQICGAVRGSYWRNFDQLILNMELKWRTTELNIGWKFGLRWFGMVGIAMPNQPFLNAWDATKQTFTGPMTFIAGGVTPGTRAGPSGGYFYNTTYGKNDEISNTREVVYNCGYSYGCPYPVSGIAAPVGFERDVDAFLARGAVWLPPDYRNMSCNFPMPASDAAFNAQNKAAWLNSVFTELQGEAAAVKALQMLSVTVLGDLVQTSAASAAEKTINDMLTKNAASLQAAQAARAKGLSEATTEGEFLTTALNYGMLVVGAGLLATALMDRKKS